jgi:hypothetical protein
MYQQLWGYKVEEKLYLGGTRTKRVEYHWSRVSKDVFVAIQVSGSPSQTRDFAQY